MSPSIAVLPASDDISRDPVGAVTVITRELLLTCAHVLRQAGYSREKGTEVRLRVADQANPAIAKLLEAPWIPQSASGWPPDEDLPPKLDVVALMLTRKLEEGPKQLRALELTDADPGTLVHSFGFPEGHPDGWEAHGQIASRSDMRGLRQLEAVSGRSPIERGFSGGPVFDETGATLGIVVSRFRPGVDDPLAPAGFMIPLAAISTLVQESKLSELANIKIEAPVIASYPKTKDLLKWAEERLEENPYGATRTTPLLPLLLAVSKSGRPAEAFCQIERLHIGENADCESSFDLLDSRQFFLAENRNYYIQAPGGAGKSFFQYELLITSVTAGVLPFFINAVAAGKAIAKVFEKEATEDRLRTLFEVSRSKIDFKFFKRADEASQRTLLVIDGLNEASAEISHVVGLISNVLAAYENVQILMTDRMSFRPEYPDSFVLATMSPLPIDLIQRILPGQFAPGYERLLRIPFFLDLVREGGPGKTANRKAVILRYVGRLLQSRGTLPQPAGNLSESEELLRLANAAYDAYAEGKQEIKQGKLKKGSELAQLPLTDWLEAGLLRRAVSSDSYRFHHQLVHDCLAAHHFTAAGLPADAEQLKTLTLERRSSDALVFVLEGLDKTRADDFIIGIYDWDWDFTLSCLVATRADPSDALATAICAVVAEKLKDTFLHTRQRSRSRLSALKRFIGIEGELPSIPEILAQIRTQENQFQGERLRRWWLAFTAETPHLELWRALVGNDPLGGWSAAAALRRIARSESSTFEQLVVLYEALKSHPDAAGHLTAVRWRIVHVLGRFPQATSLLLDIGFDSAEHPDVQYGAIRESVENASKSSEQEGREILSRALRELNDKGAALASRPLCAFRNCAILKGRADREPPWWRDAYRPLLMRASQLARVFEDEYPQWRTQIERFDADERDVSD